MIRLSTTGQKPTKLLFRFNLVNVKAGELSCNLKLNGTDYGLSIGEGGDCVLSIETGVASSIPTIAFLAELTVTRTREGEDGVNVVYMVLQGVKTDAPYSESWITDNTTVVTVMPEYKVPLIGPDGGGGGGGSVPSHAETHAEDGSDPITPSSIGACTKTDVEEIIPYGAKVLEGDVAPADRTVVKLVLAADASSTGPLVLPMVTTSDTKTKNLDIVIDARVCTADPVLQLSVSSGSETKLLVQEAKMPTITKGEITIIDCTSIPNYGTSGAWIVMTAGKFKELP